MRAKILAYLNTDLPVTERDALEDHIKNCPTCREALAEELKLVEKLRATRLLYEAPKKLEERIKKIIEEARKGKATTKRT